MCIFISAGTKTDRKYVGRAAEYCLMCRGFQPMRMVDIREVNHLYSIPIQTRRSLGLEQTCETCGLVRALQVQGDLPYFSRDRHADVESLLADTNPDARQAWAERIASDARVRSGNLSGDERRLALRESFGLANELIEQRTSEMRLDGVSGPMLFAAILGGIGTYLAVENWAEAEIDRALFWGVAVGGALAILTLILIAGDGGRYAKRHVLPVLVRAIRPLKPREDEIEDALLELRESGCELGKLLRAHQVSEAMILLPD